MNYLLLFGVFGLVVETVHGDDEYTYEYQPVLFISEVKENDAEPSEVGEVNRISALQDEIKLELCQKAVKQNFTTMCWPLSHIPLVNRIFRRNLVLTGTTPGVEMVYAILYVDCTPTPNNSRSYRAKNSVLAYKCPTMPAIYLQQGSTDKSIIIMSVNL